MNTIHFHDACAARAIAPSPDGATSLQSSYLAQLAGALPMSERVQLIK
jgi:hypothetical protein